MFNLILSARGKIMKNPLRDFGGTYLQCAQTRSLREIFQNVISDFWLICVNCQLGEEDEIIRAFPLFPHISGS